MREAAGDAVRILAFSDVHRDLEQCRRLADLSAEADVVVGAGDFASVHRGLEETVAELSAIELPAVVIPGNNETDEALRSACAGWEGARVLHGEATEVAGATFFGLGGGVPVTPWDWSFDLTEDEAEELLSACPEECVLAVHSPPKGHVDGSRGRGLGSEAILRAIEEKRPRIVFCGHIHECAGQESTVGETRVLNVGPAGVIVEV
jgi:uncharacterized protein